MARKRRPSRSNNISAIAGGLLLIVGCIWVGWLVFGQQGTTPTFANIPLPGLAPTATPVTQVPALVAEGIVLSQASQTPTLNQQQATLLANALEPDAATQAKSVSAKYVLLNYTSTNTKAAHSNVSNVPVWLIWYQKISLNASSASGGTHDLYVFIDANSGKEMLSVWV